jgi:hypothetical protein
MEIRVTPLIRPVPDPVPARGEVAARSGHHVFTHPQSADFTLASVLSAAQIVVGRMYMPARRFPGISHARVARRRRHFVGSRRLLLGFAQTTNSGEIHFGIIDP